MAEFHSREGASMTTQKQITSRKTSAAPVKARKVALSVPTDRAASVKHIRNIMGRTQAELASALGVSQKAIQSYEQGWRDVPVRIMIQLLILLALYQKRTLDDVPCWEIRKCAPVKREKCTSFTVGRGQFCWFVGSANCRPTSRKNTGPILPCLKCPVVQRLLAGRRVDISA